MQTLETPTAPNGSRSTRQHKRVQWRTPAGKKRPDVLRATTAELVRCLEHRRGIAWFRICRQVIIAGYAIGRARDRERALRRDGAESLLAMAVCLLHLADIRTGFLGKPSADGGRWSRYTLADLAQLAFGGQSEADVRRARRSLDMMIHLGWAFPTKQVKRHTIDGNGESTFRSEPAVRRLNLALMCKMLGTSFQLARDRAHADRTRGAGNVASLDAARAKSAARAPQGGDVGRVATPARAQQGAGAVGPPRRSNAEPKNLAAIAEILDLLGGS